MQPPMSGGTSSPAAGCGRIHVDGRSIDRALSNTQSSPVATPYRPWNRVEKSTAADAGSSARVVLPSRIASVAYFILGSCRNGHGRRVIRDKAFFRSGRTSDWLITGSYRRTCRSLSFLVQNRVSSFCSRRVPQNWFEIEIVTAVRTPEWAQLGGGESLSRFRDGIPTAGTVGSVR